MRSFPSLSHYHHALHTEDLPFWLHLAKQKGSPMLELGCGSGRVMQHLKRAGFTVYGLDSDAGELKYYRQSLPEAEPARVFQADMRRFHLDLKMALILLPCNTYSTLDKAEREATLKCVYDHLQPGGIFIASLPNPISLRDIPDHRQPEIEETFLHPRDGNPVQVSSAWKRTRQVFILTWIYDHLLPDGSVKRETVHTTHYLTSTYQYLDELQQAGFDAVTTFGDYYFKEFNDQSPYLIIQAEKNPQWNGFQ